VFFYVLYIVSPCGFYVGYCLLKRYAYKCVTHCERCCCETGSSCVAEPVPKKKVQHCFIIPITFFQQLLFCRDKKEDSTHAQCEISAGDVNHTVKGDGNSEPWVPPTVDFTSLKRTDVKIMSEEEFLKMFHELRQTYIKAYSCQSNVVSTTDKPYEKIKQSLEGKTAQDKQNDTL
jgi:hypothetical protein